MMRIILAALSIGWAYGFARAEDAVTAGSPPQRIAADFGLCDGPAWDGKTLFVPDVKGATLYNFHPGTSALTKIVENVRISGTCFRHGRLYVSDNGNARVAALEGHELTTLAVLDDSEKPVNRPNDLVVDQQGGVYVTLTKPNRVVYLTREGAVLTAVEAIESPNGLTLSPDEKRLYVSSYVPKEVWVYDLPQPGMARNGRKFAVMDDGKDLGADGMTIDADGNVYCAGAKAVWVWNSEGKLLTRIQTPARPINCAFGGADLKTLYITCFDGLYQQAMNVSGLSPLRDH